MQDTSRAAVVLFRGDPRREERQKQLPPRFLSTLHRQLLRLLGSLDSIDVFTASGIDDRLTIDGADRHLVTTAGSLAERIDTALSFCFAAGYGRVLLLAGDVATLEKEAIRSALHLLDRQESVAVVGRSSDGGFYLAGFNAPPSIAWTEVLLRRKHAAASLLDQLTATGIPIALLPVVDDIDDRSDAVRVIETRGFAAQVRRLLDRLASLLFSGNTPPPVRTKHRFAWQAALQLRGPPTPAVR